MKEYFKHLKKDNTMIQEEVQTHLDKINEVN